MHWTEMLMPFVSSFALTIMVMPMFIGYFRMKQIGQVTRDEGPKWHEVKTGTPTMGGVVFIIATLITAVWVGIWQGALTLSLGLLLFILALYGVLGFLDDFIKVFKKRNLGLTSKQKLIGQIIGGIIFFIVFKYEGLATKIAFPFIGSIDIGWLYGIFVIFWLVGFSNAVNLTDGLDGLVAGTASIAYGTYAVIAWHQQQTDILIFCVTIVGGLVGFFFFNKKPAKIFMGDVGSLALGGGLAAVSILLHQEWSLLLIGLIFVIETASVMIQVTSFKLTGKRVFKMSPIHHHFEMSGWSEWRVVLTFWSVGLLAAIVALLVIL
ncbi:MAG: phospho-N-acetylmuramoyl-pentapeptide-transferase [Carnobacterium sp.]|jgi:phospho-N-acetylmuramoyl-pentapeptide-transferase|uniref:Phospho-N-acetylmuramoyl-pentapeptide-transferase n=1 Tax=Carnobacterium maltaromaticum LMA28 TaxID=1234679 RepID=K8EFS5_CARML|nr:MULTISPECIES: phospho-N-acetylmuramoyl-pentapeptide-transferase [Carnobacterium]AOA01617.1 phospho-N-acetylmuramoyl-pentapeptide-transferase [Carnobacterium maltaromaticum]KRN84372.1 phospho-N-acetylmuramoyl-pentapeptide-transferase [Carnobacterium maltaromaticum]MBC9787102.1 phospho-N-acetylmuramoyl-pentapeptide-transferase [Carnobacterium maltaromaticum]MBQ6485038.1 phospho-N-acetylmuramoyl-pentapeptide-transferase [Carnobacterium sp.]MCC4311733.1 phospho-N-acetylmuramoyl-pentapeptide-tra